MTPAYVAAGANVPGPAGPPAATLAAARVLLARRGVRVVARSRTYRSAPWGGIRQPVFLNEVWAVTSPLEPQPLLALLLATEQRLGRRRRVRWGPRAIDLDLIGWGGRQGVWEEGGAGRPNLVLPHPHLAARAFVLRPLADVAPRWRVPGLGADPGQLLARLGPAGLLSARPVHRS